MNAKPYLVEIGEALQDAAHRKAQVAAVRRESDRALRDMIRRRQALPPAERTNFLRVRAGRRGTAL